MSSLLLPRRRLGLASLLGAAFARRAVAGSGTFDVTGACTPTIPSFDPTAERPPPQVDQEDYSLPEVQSAFHCNGFNPESLALPITPVGDHYIFTHFDVQYLSADNYAVALGGLVNNPRQIPLTEIMGRQTITQTVTMECAGVGRRTLQPRPVYTPWDRECIGTYQWTGTPLAPLLHEAGLMDGAVEVLFSGWDYGIDLGVKHVFERSLPIDEAMKPEVMLAWAHNGQPLLPLHGFPLRLIVPSWYGVASVKWLRAITVLPQPFQGVEQAQVYVYQYQKDGPSTPITRKRADSTLLPPGAPDMLTRTRFVNAGQYQIMGKAWSGIGSITNVEFSGDGGNTWQPAQLSAISSDPYAWVHWTANWTAKRGPAILMCRATDSSGFTQPVDPQALWNLEGAAVAAAQQQPVIVIGSQPADILAQVPCQPQLVRRGAKLPPPVPVTNTVA